MNGIILILILIAELLVCLFLVMRTVSRCKSAKKTYFISFVCLLFLYVLGYLLEVISGSFESAYAGLRVEYLGAAVIAPISLLFIMDLCDLKITVRRMAALFIIPLATLVLVWTCEYHHYYYTDMRFVTSAGISQIVIEGGTWYYVHYAFAMLCLLVACVHVVMRYFKLGRDMRKQFPLLLISPLLQVAPQLMYAMGFRAGNVFYPVLFLPVTAVLLFIYLMRYNEYDVKSQTSELALDFIRDAYLLVDRDYRVLHANRTAVQLTGFGKIRVGKRIDRLEGWPGGLTSLEPFTKEDGQVDFEHRVGYESKFFRADINRITASGGGLLGWVLLIRDVTETKFLMERIEGIAYTDALTGLINRNRFMELAEREFEKRRTGNNTELSVIIVGMDEYKKINDTYGDMVGDTLIRLISESLGGILGHYPLFARYTGTQFILLADVDSKQAEELAVRIKNEIAYRAYEVEGTIIKCTACVGVSAKLNSADTLGDVIHKSSEALRRAQAKGFSRVECYY